MTKLTKEEVEVLKQIIAERKRRHIIFNFFKRKIVIFIIVYVLWYLKQAPPIHLDFIDKPINAILYKAGIR